jgi:2-polyprenyl-3-methyl-5-hydroxy-6-metoxy-1,4-benzoquinol methylase
MRDSRSESVESTLRAEDVHRRWERSYRTVENEKFGEMVFDHIIGELRPPEGATFLDAGCGGCAHSIRLARRGFHVQAVDFSESALKMAQSNVDSSGLGNMISLKQENLVALSFRDQTFDYILCWGVLMHIPEVGTAVSELARVLRKGGKLVVSEANMYSLQSVAHRALKRALGRRSPGVARTASGLEQWARTEAGELLMRQADVRWLKNAFEDRRVRVIRHIPGQFSELYTRFSSPMMTRIIHGLNYAWFRHVRAPGLSFGNIIIFEKDE